MKRIALLAGLFLPALVAQADSMQTSPNIAVARLGEIFERYQMTKDLEDRFDRARLAIADEAENRRQAIQNQAEALESFKPTSKEYTERKTDLQRAQIEFRLWLETEEQRIKNDHMGWLRHIYDNVRGAVESEATARGIDVVLADRELPEDLPNSDALRQEILVRPVLFYSQRVDLTEPVLAVLNQAYAKGGGAASLNADAPQPDLPPRVKKPAVE